MAATAQTEAAWVSAAIEDREEPSLSPERSEPVKAQVKKQARKISPDEAKP